MSRFENPVTEPKRSQKLKRPLPSHHHPLRYSIYGNAPMDGGCGGAQPQRLASLKAWENTGAFRRSHTFSSFGQITCNLALPTSDNAIPNEGSVVTSLGMAYVHIPVDFKAPTQKDSVSYTHLTLPTIYSV